ncbi:MAG: DNA methyltransferase [bacterium]
MVLSQSSKQKSENCWKKIKEGFSRDLVFRLLKELDVGKEEIVLDPFAGCGTTLLACKEFGYPAVGLEILPIAVYVAKIKLLDWPDLPILSQYVEELFKKKTNQKGNFQMFESSKKLFQKMCKMRFCFTKKRFKNLTHQVGIF